VQLEKNTSPIKKKILIDQLRQRFSNVPGVKIEVKDFEQGPPIEAPVAIRILGDNLDTLRTLAARAERITINPRGYLC
jgi:Cu/Ag efflux pump CusA